MSLPLLKLRSRKDLVETLLHEMIHAFLFVTREGLIIIKLFDLFLFMTVILDDNHESHGVQFHHHMCRINQMAGTNITVYHNFHDEVRHYQRHIWECDGPCKTRPPFYGVVRRVMNRKPGPNDSWWSKHQAECGGNFIKVSEPEMDEKNKGKRSKKKQNNTNENKTNGNVKTINDIRNYFTLETSKSVPGSSVLTNNGVNNSTCDIDNKNKTSTFVPFSGSGHVLGNLSDNKHVVGTFSSTGQVKSTFPGTGHVLGTRSDIKTKVIKIEKPNNSKSNASSTATKSNKIIEIIDLD